MATKRLDDYFHLRSDFYRVPAAVLFGMAVGATRIVGFEFMKQALTEKLARLGQQHLLAFWDRLDSTTQQRLAQQINAIDWNEFEQLRNEHGGAGDQTAASQQHWRTLAEKCSPPPAVRLGKEPHGFTRSAAVQRGEEALRSGKVGMILVAGGLGTRLGFDSPKGMFPLGPVSNRPLFQILIDQLRAISRRFGVRIPLYVMTSPATHDVTEKFLQEHQRFGLPAEDLQLFQQGTMFAVEEATFNILLDTPGEIFTGPDGHGGMLAALKKKGVLADARRRGIEQFFYGQIDNPLLTICDPELIGCHLLADSELTTQVVAKSDPAEKVGVVIDVEGRTQIIEYVDLPADLAPQTLPDGSLKFWAGNIAVHVFNVAFLERAASQANALPFHTSRKKVPYTNNAGERIEPSQPNAIRFERFIFDLLPLAERALVVEVDKALAFAPVKNSDQEKTDTPTTARNAMIAQARELLTAAGASVNEGIAVEVNPLWALDSAEAKAKLSPGTQISQPTYFA